MSEHTDLLATLTQSRFFLRNTTRDLTDEQVGMHTTVSVLCLGGLIKHVTDAEEAWANFILEGPSALGGGKNFTEWTEEDYARREASFQMQPGDTLAGVLERYEQVARRTDELVPTLDLDASHPLPEAPWFEPGARWSARRVLMNIVAETTHHSGHADIIREALDGAKSMG
ncbi:MAG: DinB family protein [Pseudonocardiaceae bacterium]